jgi:hypothetical protein
MHYEEMYVEFKINFKIMFDFLCFNLGNSENELEGNCASICGRNNYCGHKLNGWPHHSLYPRCKGFFDGRSRGLIPLKVQSNAGFAKIIFFIFSM